MTMSTFSPIELARMQATQESAMQDECIFFDYTEGTLDGFGRPTNPFSEGLTTKCGFKPVTKGEAMGEGEVVMKDAILRLPIALAGVLAQTMKIQITKRFGETLANPIMFNVLGDPEQGPSGLVLKLEKITDGTNANPPN